MLTSPGAGGCREGLGRAVGPGGGSQKNLAFYATHPLREMGCGHRPSLFPDFLGGALKSMEISRGRVGAPPRREVPPHKSNATIRRTGPHLVFKSRARLFSLQTRRYERPRSSRDHNMWVGRLAPLLFVNQITDWRRGCRWSRGGIQLGMARLESTHPLLFRDSKQNQIHQAARPYNVGGLGSPSLWSTPPDPSPHAQVPDASKHRGVTGVHVKGVAPRPVPGLSVAPGLRPLTPRGPSVAPGPRPPVLGHTTWRGTP